MSLLVLLVPVSTGLVEATRYQPGEESPHGELGEPCSSCHAEVSWNELRDPLGFDHSSRGFALLFGHDDLKCQSCHESLVFSEVEAACADCHEDPHSGGLGHGCETCHAPSGWDNRRKIFDLHSATMFPLTGAHAAADCFSCHQEEPALEFSTTPTDCFSCHRGDYQAATRPDHARTGFPTDCATCHITSTWQEARVDFGPDFDHDLFYSLTGAHRGEPCASCHAGGYSGTPTDCFSCHRADYDSATAPDHLSAGFPTTCEACHGTDRWQGATFDHDEFFVLKGAHRSAACESCHVDGTYVGTPTDCYSCHRADFDGTDDPPHLSAGFSTSCEVCHGTDRWEGATFDHDPFFALTGVHRKAACESCHVDGTYAGTPTECYSCHRSDYDGADDPPHLSAGFPTACESCHGTRRWQGADFDHDPFFALTGAHRQASCASCHADGVYAGTPRDCYSCHTDDYNETDDPNHQSAGFSTTCESCHGTDRWEGATFDHDQFFELTGAHRRASCESCHADGVYAGTPKDCYSCHAADYDQTDDPNHQSAGFPTSCEACHGTDRWEGAAFDHDQFFELTGAHRQASCESCHADGVYAGTPKDCYSCHAADYDQTDDPNHQSASFPTSCEACHGTDRWEGATFDHDQFFELTGAHRQASCDSCHADGVYAGTPRDCYSCHANDYNRTDDPNHRAAGFPTTCESCHDTQDWDNATFDHDQYFRLEGAHARTPCESCHANGYAGTPTDCFSCHAADYDATTDPNHRAAGFPTTCESCHDTSDWDNADFDHEAFFPINNGPHRGVACNECHVVPNNFQEFECIECHEHRRSEMDDEHDDVSGYIWDSQYCYACHPNGRE